MFQSRSRFVCTCVLAFTLAGISACSGPDGETLITEAPFIADVSPTSSFPSSEQPISGGELEGMQGISPRSVEVNAQWLEEVSAFSKSQGKNKQRDLMYAAEAYDAVVVVALAVEVAGTDGAALADEIVDITVGGSKCTSFAECLLIIEEGGNPDYEGISGPLDFNGNGEPLKGSYAVLQYGADNLVDESLTTFISAELPDSAIIETGKTTSTRPGDGQLKFGSLLSKSSNTALDGDPELAGLEYAIAEINNEGGVLGKQILYVKGIADDADIGNTGITVDYLISENVDVIIGPDSSSATLSVIDKVVAAGITMFSPANTSPALSNYPDDNLYFRNALPDGLQGATLANVISKGANKSVYILYINDAYGHGIKDVLRTALEIAGIDVLATSSYERDTTSFETEIEAIRTLNPDAVALISFREESLILRTAVNMAIGPRLKNWYGTEGVLDKSFGADFESVQ